MKYSNKSNILRGHADGARVHIAGDGEMSITLTERLVPALSVSQVRLGAARWLPVKRLPWAQSPHQTPQQFLDLLEHTHISTKSYGADLCCIFAHPTRMHIQRRSAQMCKQPYNWAKGHEQLNAKLHNITSTESEAAKHIRCYGCCTCVQTKWK